MYFAMFMVAILVLTGFIWLLDIWALRKNRPQNASEPWYVEYSKSFFPVILLVFVLRSFLVEPFKIPSASMLPTLQAGDYILVNKYVYGLRVPILNNTFYEISQPKRGDVIVFHYPPEPTVDYIKRVIGLPGDEIKYQDKQLTINGKIVDLVYQNDYGTMTNGIDVIQMKRLSEQLGDVVHDVLVDNQPSRYADDSLGEKLANGETITVPQGSYFAMGDNRDNSADSRVWGFVPEKNLVGKAFYIWFNFDSFDRIGNGIQ